MSKCMISVLMISYNQEQYIEQAIRSVLNLERDLYDLEILIVDDGSSDNTQKIIKNIQKERPDVLFPILKEHEGIEAINKNLNELIYKASGDFVAFLAGDDNYLPQRFTNDLKIIQSDAAVELVVSEGVHYNVIDKVEQGSCQEKYIVDMINSGQLNQVYEYATQNVPKLLIQGYLIRKQTLFQVGAFDESAVADDWVLNIKLFEYLRNKPGSVVYTPDVTFAHNIHENNTAKNIEQHCKRILTVFKKYAPTEKRKDILSRWYIRCGLLALKKTHFITSIKYFSNSLILLRYSVRFVYEKIVGRL